MPMLPEAATTTNPPQVGYGQAERHVHFFLRPHQFRRTPRRAP